MLGNKFLSCAGSGRCICQHNTVGASCERCAPGYYGYALAGTPNDCKPCPCPDGGQCVQLINGDVACVGCKEGYTGQFINVRLWLMLVALGWFIKKE